MLNWFQRIYRQTKGKYLLVLIKIVMDISYKFLDKDMLYIRECYWNLKFISWKHCDLIENETLEKRKLKFGEMIAEECEQHHIKK